VGLTLDAGALILAERNDRRFWSAWSTAGAVPRWIPAPALAQVWRGAPSARIANLLRSCTVEPLDEELAKAAGVLLGRSRTSDVIDATVVASAARRGDAILTTDPLDLLRLTGLVGRRLRIVAL
jgi:hypothetical protein